MRVADRIWNTRRQVLGNVIPFAMGAVAFLMLFQADLVTKGLVAVLVAYLSIDRWGFFENRKIEQELRDLTKSDGEIIGFVYKNPAGAWDAHAELGLLIVRVDHLDVLTENGGLAIKRNEISKISRQGNIHSLIGLGGWVALELTNGQTFKLESRKYHTMFASKIRSAKLLAELERWLKLKSPAEAGPN